MTNFIALVNSRAHFLNLIVCALIWNAVPILVTRHSYPVLPFGLLQVAGGLSISSLHSLHLPVTLLAKSQPSKPFFWLDQKFKKEIVAGCVGVCTVLAT